MQGSAQSMSAGRGRVWVGLATLVVVLAGFVLTLGSVPARAAAGDVLDCTPMGDPACRDLVPIAECVWPNPDGSRTVVWGFDNPSSKVLRIEPGAHNQIAPGPDDQGQPQVFPPGRASNAFVSTFTGSTGSWRLGNTRVTANGSTTQCATQPVPVVGSVEALLLGITVIGLVLLVVLAARRRPKVVSA